MSTYKRKDRAFMQHLAQRAEESTRSGQDANTLQTAERNDVLGVILAALLSQLKEEIDNEQRLNYHADIRTGLHRVHHHITHASQPKAHRAHCCGGLPY
jgi:hypothetical protein